MERQRSFSVKSTRLMVFSLSLLSSMLLFSYVFTFRPFLTRDIFLKISVRDPVPQNITSIVEKIPLNEVKNGVFSHAHMEDSTHFGRKTVSGVSRGEVRSNGVEVPVLADTQEDSTHFGRKTVSGVSRGEVRSNGAEVPVLADTQDEESHNYSTRGMKSAAVQELRVDRNQSEALIEGKKIVDAQSSIQAEKPLINVINFTWERKMPTVESSKCDLSRGRWVFDESYPLYSNRSCPFIDEGFNCQSNGRVDKDYMKWRWQPHDCNIPRFNPAKMLELIRGKRLVFAGDSLNRNQWESMLCLMKGAVKDPRRVYEAHGRKITKSKGNYHFKFLDYQCSVEFYVTHFLVHESKARVGKKRVQTLRIDTIDKGSSKWKGADILVFNTAHWWSHYKTKSGVNYYQERDQVHNRLDVSAAFRTALTAWASWVDQHIKPSKTRVFFRNSEPSHFSGGQWNSGGHCREAKQPLNDTFGRRYPEKNMIAEEVISRMKTPVTILNITGLSEFRIDGHPSIYGGKVEKGSSTDIQDCSHWCLPGVPDTWNELLYFHLLTQQKTVSAE